ncbi:1-Cys peroxiredoxin [Seminavis robusta]|uniref:1-Cys peroxiredoxin n=1 Tax=Seminavis robusta TaxID=568900 RepID=A0A9N8E661_9STRA|nr:1-Cys peroxiredoxin [Seminavis robusta]|eukprot:Sro584_g170850.1 1-Cys peroxiredoxin (321) ;mRNA; r:42776-43830
MGHQPGAVAKRGSNSGCSAIQSGTLAYMSLYPKDSTDGVLRLGNIVPDFEADTTKGHMRFHKWKQGKWAILFSHPADFTPVCTTEIASLATKYAELVDMDCKVATLSVDPVTAHDEWLKDVIAQHTDGKISIDFPIIADPNRDISTAYGMIDPWSSDRQDLPLTIRCVFIINPENKLMLSLNYPACVGRNMTEIVRCVKALQLSYQKSVATPANWPDNHSEVVMPDGTTSKEYKGSVFLLPTVTDKEADKYYPGYYTSPVPSEIPYLRLVKPEQVGLAPTNKKGVETKSGKEKHYGAFSWFSKKNTSKHRMKVNAVKAAA